MIADFFKIFQDRLKLQTQILLLLVISTVVPVSVVGMYGIFTSSTTLSQLSENELENESEEEADEIINFLDGVNDNVLFLSKVPPTQGIIRARDGGGTDKQSNFSYADWVKQMETIFTAKMESKPTYIQLRYLDEKGEEIVRVDSDGTKTTVIPEAQLQNKADRGYFTETMNLSVGSVYVSPLDLNRENGRIQEPYTPVIRYATPIVDSAGRKRGIIIANVFAERFITTFENEQNDQDGKIRQDQGRERFLINQEGYYLSHTKNDKEWGFELGHNHKLEEDFPSEVVKEILSSEEGIIEYKGDILSYHRVDPSPQQPEYLVAIDKIPKSSVFASVNSFKIAASLIVIVSLAAVLPVGIIRGSQLTNLIKQLVNAISSSSQQTFSTMTQQERVASQQAASVNETTTTMDELEASCRQSSEQAQAAVTAAKQALKLSEDGSKAVGENLEGMSSLEKKVEAIAQQIVQLSEQANQIGGISQLVSDLANQTNMLALNSSVEAARAGEHGKGFAVVANEIRKLSDQSQKSADKISIIVSDIQKSINSTVMVSEEGTKTAKMGLETAHQTEQAFSGVKDAIDQVVLNNQQISLNLKEQVNGIQQIVEAMDIINQGAKETATGIGQTREGTEELNQIALELKQMV